jgi:hypothetical protein
MEARLSRRVDGFHGPSVLLRRSGDPVPAIQPDGIARGRATALVIFLARNRPLCELEPQAAPSVHQAAGDEDAQAERLRFHLRALM